MTDNLVLRDALFEIAMAYHRSLVELDTVRKTKNKPNDILKAVEIAHRFGLHDLAVALTNTYNEALTVIDS